MYEKAFGQAVNFDKSALTFSPSTSSLIIDEIVDVLHVPTVQGHNIYLGLPTFSLRSKILQFGYLREMIDKKINDWSNRFFSSGGREVLI